MSTKRVILANGSRLIREILHRVIDKETNLRVVQELTDHEEVPSAIEQFDPEWVILSLPRDQQKQHWAEDCVAAHPSVRFIFLSPDHGSITMRWQTSYEEDLTDLSLKDFIQILEKDLQHT